MFYLSSLGRTPQKGGSGEERSLTKSILSLHGPDGGGGGGSVTKSRPTLVTWTVAHQAPLSMGFPRQEYWSGLPFPFSRGASRPRDQTRVSCIAGRFFYQLSYYENSPQTNQQPFSAKTQKRTIYHNLFIRQGPQAWHSLWA